MSAIRTSLSRRAGYFLTILWIALVGLIASPTVWAASAPPAMITPGQFNVGATGAATYTIPIAVPPGTGGMVPALSLDYSSQSGDGLEGLGWTLSGIPSIGRCPRTIAQDGVHGSVNYDNNDRFCMEGQRLVATSGTYGADGTVYHTEIESFSKIVSHGTSGTGPAYFEVHTKAGQVMYFGWNEDTDNSGNNSRFVLSSTNATARAWGAEKIEDTKGNFLIVKYTNDTAAGQSYPNEIDYTGNSSTALSPYARVVFSYTTRSDVVPTYQAGYLLQTTQLLTDIKTQIQNSDGSWPSPATSWVSDYKLTYNPASAGDSHNELISVQQCDDASQCLATTTFGWQGSRDTLNISTVSNDLAGNSSSFVPGDFNGDGLTDASIVASSNCGIFLGQQDNSFVNGNFTANYTYYTKFDGPLDYSGPACFNLATVPVYYTKPLIMDLNGDGLTDTILPIAHIYDDVPTQLHILTSSGAASLDEQYTLDTETGDLGEYGDFNGDGITDTFVAQWESSHREWFVLGTGWVDPGYGGGTFTLGDFDGDGCSDVAKISASPIVATLSCKPSVPSFSFPSIPSGLKTVFGDFNGDGKTDLLTIGNGAAGSLYLSSGTGLVLQSFAVPNDWGKYSVQIGDWNGDGKTDIALIASGGSGMYGVGTTHKLLLSTGNTFIQKATIDNSNAMDTSVTATAADWNNDGATDLWLKKASGDTEELFNFVPELMVSVSNGIGATTTFTYDRLNKNGSLYVKCPNAPTAYLCGDTYPMQSIDGAMYVVSRVDSSNGLGVCTPPSMTNCYSSAYAYSGAKVDLSGRGFLGFASMTVTDAQTHIVQTTTYRQDFPYTGLIDTQKKVCASGCSGGAVTLSNTANTYNPLTISYSGTGVTGGSVVIAELKEVDVTSADTDGSTMPEVDTNYTYDCDTVSCGGASPTGFGNATSVVVTTKVSATPVATKTTTNIYANDSTNWLLGRLIGANVQSAVSGEPTLTRYTAYCYDLPFATAGPGGTSCPAAGASGLLTAEIVEPQDAVTNPLRLETDYSYDAFGNKAGANSKACTYVSGTCTATSRTTNTDYDAAAYHGQFATKTTNALNQFETWSYAASQNQQLGLPSSHTGPNGLTTSWSYDNFGRKTVEIRPDSNRTAVSYILCPLSACSGLPTGDTAPTNTQFAVVAIPENSSSAQNGPVTVTFYDGLSRVIAVDSEGFDGSGTGCTIGAPCWIRVATQYDPNGRVQQSSRPYFLTGGTPQWSSYIYDPIGRVSTTTYPDGTTTVYTYQGLKTTVQDERQLGSTITYQNTITIKNAEGQNQTVTDNDGKSINYTYDVFGDLLTITDPSSPPHVTTYVYDTRGRKTQATDPDMGLWTYKYDGYGELYQQTDAKAQVTTLTYDVLGRVTQRVEADLTSNWTYDTAMGAGVGQLYQATTGSGYTRTFVYDSLGRPQYVTLAVDGTGNTYTIAYTANGQIDTVSYPSSFVAKYNYTTLGYLQSVSDNGGSHQVFWTANARDAELHLLQGTAGNGVVSNQIFDPQTGRLKAISAGTGGSATVSNQNFTYDSLGNLWTRKWLQNATTQATENACYDDLNRLTSTLVTTGTACTGSGAVAVSYDALGNITEKTDICGTANCFVYGGGAGPHALTSIVGSYNGVSNPTFTYDGNGNMTGGAGRSVNLTSFNMAASVSDGANSNTLTYDTEHSRIKQVASGITASTTTYLNDPASGAMEEKLAVGANTTWRDYIMADGHMVAQRTVGLSAPPAWGTVAWSGFQWTAQSATTPQLLYFTLDQLGSVSVVTDHTGFVVERDSYDAWGKRRNIDGTAIACTNGGSYTTRGFTGQEMMDNVCLINFNARLYDPSLGRFMSADPTTETVFNLQILNRYAYVINNPLSLTDPSGLCFLGCFWKSPIFIAIVGVAIALFVPYALWNFSWAVFSAAAGGSIAAIGAVAAGGILSGAITAGLGGGNVLQGALFGGLSAIASIGGAWLGGQIGGLLIDKGVGAVTAGYIGRAIGQGLTGGLASEIEGGNFGSGFLAAGVGSLAGRLQGESFDPVDAIAAAVLGGVGSVLGGGKFANGALTGAFSYAASASYDNEAPGLTTSKATGTAGSISSTAEFTIDKETFMVMGAKSMGEVEDVQNDLLLIFSTPRGGQMLDALETRANLTFGIDLTIVGDDNADHPGLSNLIHIDPNFHPLLQTTDGPEPADLTIALAHEIGHAAFGTPEGPDNMTNVRLNENPVRRSLGYPARTAYPAVQ